MALDKKDFFAYSHYLSALSDERFCGADYWKVNHDTWYVYRFGNGYKIVYIKYGSECSRSAIPKKLKPMSAKEKEQRLSQSVSRTKSTIFELAFCNEFSHFCTFTQNIEKVGDRYNLAKFRKELAQFVRNQNRGREQKIKYLFVPEQHKDGAWHIHGLVMGLTDADLREFSLSEKLPQKIRKQLLKGEKVYNWEKYSEKFGFFTATKIKSHDACAKYVTKYITKNVVETALDNGAHTYFASQGLKRKERVFHSDYELCPITDWGFENDYVKTVFYETEEKFLEAMS